MASSLTTEEKLITFGFGCVLLVAFSAIDWYRKKKREANAPQEDESKLPKGMDQLVKSLSRDAARGLMKEFAEEDYKKDPTVFDVKSLDNIYVHVVPESYLQDLGDLSGDFIRPLGHGLYSVLVYDLEGMIRFLHPRDFEQIGKSADELFTLGIKNLARMGMEEKIVITPIRSGPQGKPFVLAADHWCAASWILLPGFFSIFVDTLGTSDICVSVPNRETMLVFAKGDDNYRKEMKAFIREKEEGESAKPLTWNFFEVDGESARP